MKKRQSSFELLRIIAMCMIICMHYINKGMNLPKLCENVGMANCFYHLMYSFCLGAVNAYVLISGYFLCDAEWHIGKVVKLWVQVLTYSVLIALITWVLGYVDLLHMGLSDLQQILLPVEYEHYWFATAYVMMYLLAPVLAIAVNSLDQNQLKAIILGLLVLTCGLKSVNPYLIPWDRYGCDVIWFICLFLVAGYIKKYGIKITGSLKNSVITYVSCSALTFIIALIYAILVQNTGKFEYSLDMVYSYNYITVLLASLGVFGIFLTLSRKEATTEISRFNAFINKVGGCTFGVYLLHEHLLIRFEWYKWLGIEYVQDKWYQLLHLVACVVIVMTVGVLVELSRMMIVNWVTKRNVSFFNTGEKNI